MQPRIYPAVVRARTSVTFTETVRPITTARARTGRYVAVGIVGRRVHLIPCPVRVVGIVREIARLRLRRGLHCLRRAWCNLIAAARGERCHGIEHRRGLRLYGHAGRRT